ALRIEYCPRITLLEFGPEIAIGLAIETGVELASVPKIESLTEVFMNTRSTPDLSRMQALILAGGEGKHLFPLTLSRPKPVMTFGGIFRIVDFTLSNCLRSKLTSVALLTQYQHEQLRSYVGYAWTEVWNNPRPQPQPLLCLPPTNDQ